MRRGDFAAAWAISDRVLTERRARNEDCSRWPRHLQYIWDGSSFDGKHVLVRCYHGLGDTIQYARFMEPLRRRASQVTLWAQPALLPLLQNVRGIDQLIPLHDGAPQTAYDVDLEIMEVAHALRVDTSTLCERVRYLGLPPGSNASHHSLKVGIAWRSGDWDARRSIHGEALAPLGALPGIEWHSLQYPSEPLPFESQDLACRDISAMAMRMRDLDLVLSVDTMVAHLAGAMGLPTWLLLNREPDWRWGDRGQRTTWYPSMRLFRSDADGWPALIGAVSDALREERDRTIAAHYRRSDGCTASSG